MRATRILRSRSSGSGSGTDRSYVFGVPKLLLPAPTLWDRVSPALQGFWSHLSDQSARDAYEDAVNKHVIKDTVLQNAIGGTAITFGLFHNLQNPLFKENKFDAKEFVDAVGPALENFHETLASLRNELPEILDQEEKQEEKEQRPKSEEELMAFFQKGQLTSSVLGANIWRQQAEKDSDSLAGQLSKMTTDVCFDAFYYSSKLEILSRAALTGGSVAANKYIAGSCKVNEVALLHARAMVINEDQVNNNNNKEEEETVEEYSEFRASEEDSSLRNQSVAAQIDILYEVTHAYQESLPVLTDNDEEQKEPLQKVVGDDVESSGNTVKDGESKDAVGTESGVVAAKGTGRAATYLYTNLAVAVFEGWLHRGSNKKGEENGLRWKIAALREAFEFPHHEPTIIRSESS